MREKAGEELRDRTGEGARELELRVEAGRTCRAEELGGARPAVAAGADLLGDEGVDLCAGL